MIVQLARIVLLAGGALGGFAASRLADWPSQTGFSPEFVIVIFIILGGALGYLLGGILGRELTAQYHRLEQQIQQFETTDLILGAIGLVVGLIVAFLISQPLRLITPTWLAFLSTVLVYGLFAYGGTRLFLTKRREVRERFGGVFERDTRPLEGGMKLLDTSAIIDGRFVELMRAGLLEGDVRVPRFVLAELQTLADSADDTKRARGRRGLDLLTTLANGPESITVFETDYPEIPTVDAKLVRLAGVTGSALVTVDHNLSQVARVEGVKVVNINDIALAVRPALLPGDTVHISITREGKEHGQGVGYLEDGTMVVVAEGKHCVGTDVDVEVTSMLQT
ncbi:MAG TPA: TRAM domain-containing protein, partial [Coriobacteriia bacterium]|nr:TRAM domain-containing protein [Coriobacteriia bacterium]